MQSRRTPAACVALPRHANGAPSINHAPQMTAQDVSTMMRVGAAPIIILVNNAGYAIEIEIHDGPYNK